MDEPAIDVVDIERFIAGFTAPRLAGAQAADRAAAHAAAPAAG